MKKLFLFLSSIMSVALFAATPINYTVKDGETLSSIAKKCRTTIEELKTINGVKERDSLKRGMVLRVNMNSYSAKNVIKKEVHTLQVAKIKRVEIRKVVHTPRIAKIKKIETKKVVKKKIVKKIIKKKTYIAKKDKVRNIKITKLVKALKRHAKPLRLKKARTQNRVTLSDIFFKSSRSIRGNNSEKASNIINIAKTKLGRKYVWGAIGQEGTFDCSGFTSYVYRKNGINIPRTSRNQAKYGKYVSRNNLKKGDLIFFDTSKRRKGYVNHVGIYLGHGKFIHASSAKKKVVVSSLSKFYAKCYVGARRPS